jgi:hypothetical protein
MFKHAYVRGVQNALIQGGHVAFPSGDDACKVADYIAARVELDPTNGEVVSPQKTAEIADAVIDASNWYQGQPGFKAAAFAKLASIDDLDELAHAHAIHLMEKSAEGSTIEGGDKGNTEPTTGEGVMDAAARPEGYAADSRGYTEIDTRPGAVGDEEPQPNAPAVSPPGDNSVIEQSRTASLQSMISKLAEGSTIIGGDKGNTTPTTGEGKMDASLRPKGYAVLPQQGALGQMMAIVGGPAVIGKEVPQPMKPGESPAGTNSVIQHSQKAAAEADPYLLLFKKTASEVSPHLPTTLSDDTKVAHVRACMGMTTEEKAHYLSGLQKDAADKTSGEMPAFIQEKIDAKKDGGGDKKDDDKDDDKKDDDKKDDDDDDEKSASLADHLRRITDSVQA